MCASANRKTQLKKIKLGISKIKIKNTDIYELKKAKNPVSKVLAEGQKNILRI